MENNLELKRLNPTKHRLSINKCKTLSRISSKEKIEILQRKNLRLLWKKFLDRLPRQVSVQVGVGGEYFKDE